MEVAYDIAYEGAHKRLSDTVILPGYSDLAPRSVCRDYLQRARESFDVIETALDEKIKLSERDV